MSDILKTISSAEIKNGTLIVSVYPTGPTDSNKNNDFVSNKPIITDIENKYSDKFDDPSYYTA